VELLVRPADVGVAVAEPASAASGASSRAPAGALAGVVLGGLAGLAATFLGVSMPGFESVLGAGPLSAALAGAGLGAIAGGAVGTMTSLGARVTHAGYELETLRRGGALVTVHADESRVDELERILHQQGAYLIEDRVAGRRDRAWAGGNPLAANVADEANDRVRVRERIRPNRVSAGGRR
jgi:hypothetical protein